jgi:hypothetical protein
MMIEKLNTIVDLLLLVTNYRHNHLIYKLPHFEQLLIGIVQMMIEKLNAILDLLLLVTNWHHNH